MGNGCYSYHMEPAQVHLSFSTKTATETHQPTMLLERRRTIWAALAIDDGGMIDDGNMGFDDGNMGFEDGMMPEDGAKKASLYGHGSPLAVQQPLSRQ